jgi:hypothetical protein
MQYVWASGSGRVTLPWTYLGLFDRNARSIDRSADFLILSTQQEANPDSPRTFQTDLLSILSILDKKCDACFELSPRYPGWDIHILDLHRGMMCFDPARIVIRLAWSVLRLEQVKMMSLKWRAGREQRKGSGVL